MRVFWLVLLLSACGAKVPSPTPRPPEARDADRDACAELCAREKTCHHDEGCAATCDADRARMKPGFVATYVRCFAPKLECTLDDKAREALHLECFDAALAGFARDPLNQRDMAEAVCNRGERCQGLGEAGRAACMQATLSPIEPEVKLGQRLVDALRPSRVAAFRACVDQTPCPKPGAPEDAVDVCYAKTIAGAP